MSTSVFSLWAGGKLFHEFFEDMPVSGGVTASTLSYRVIMCVICGLKACAGERYCEWCVELLRPVSTRRASTRKADGPCDPPAGQPPDRPAAPELVKVMSASLVPSVLVSLLTASSVQN